MQANVVPILIHTPEVDPPFPNTNTHEGYTELLKMMDTLFPKSNEGRDHIIMHDDNH